MSAIKKCRKQVLLTLWAQGKLSEYSRDIKILQEREYSQKFVEIKAISRFFVHTNTKNVQEFKPFSTFKFTVL